MPSPWTFPKTSLDGTPTVDDEMPNLHSTCHDKPCTPKDEQANCKVSGDVILPNAVVYSSGAETQRDSENTDVKIRNEAHGLIICSVPDILAGTPAVSRTHDTQSISEVFERILALSESVKILRTFRLRNMKRPKACSDSPCPI